MSALPKGFAAAARAYDNASPDESAEIRWEAYEAWAEDRSAEDTLQAMRDFMDGPRVVVGTYLTGPSKHWARTGSVKADLMELFQEWDAETNWPEWGSYL